MARRSSATLNRILQAIPVLIGVVVISFVLTRALPGDPAVQFAGAAATPESIEEVRRSLGLDKPLPEQFLIYVGDLLQEKIFPKELCEFIALYNISSCQQKHKVFGNSRDISSIR